MARLRCPVSCSALSLPTLEDAAEKLLDLTLTRGAPDNVSFIIVRAG